MIFRRIHVEGFGIWKDLDLRDLSPGLNLFLAPNEGGKSTLMAFIRAILFGFKRRGDPHRYEPLRGGLHGGFLEIDIDGAGYRIRRSQGSSSRGTVEVTDEKDEQFSEAKLQNLLCHTTETLYENVFAFGLDELQQLDTLQADEVAGHIYSAGMGSGAVSPVAFRAQLQEWMDDLYRPKGKKQPLARLLAEIEADEEQIERLRQRPEEHAELSRQIKRTRERLNECDAALEQRRMECEAVQRAQGAWASYESLLGAEEILRSIGVEPEQLRQRAAAVEDALEARADGADRKGLPKSSVAVQAASITVDAGTIAALEVMSKHQRGLLEEANKIRALLAQADRLTELHSSVLDRQQEASALRHALFNDLEDLGSIWSLERVRNSRTDITARDEIRRWSDRQQQAQTSITASETRAADANLVYEAIQESREQITRGTLMISWGLVVLAVVLTAVLVPEEARLASVASIVSVGALLGTLVTWLHARGLRQRRSEQAFSAEREADLWHQHELAKEDDLGARSEWQDWLSSHHLPADLTTQGALDLLDRIKQTQDKDQTASAAEAAVSTVKAELQQACMNVLTVFEQIDRSIEDLRYDAMKMVDPLVGAIKGVQAELDDVEAHRARVRHVLDEHARGRAAIKALAGDEGFAAFRARLERWDPESLARTVGDAQGKLTSARADRDAVAENLGALRQQIEALETDPELSNRLVGRESRRAALAHTIQEWAGHAVAAALYDEAKRKYEAERQPEILRTASRYLAMMTDGHYTRVIAPLGESRLEVERALTGERLAPWALSRGTGEQLYLAMRLALAKVYGSEAVPLPLVADDILVNFDDDRARATAALLDVYAAEGQQILAFTCHRHLVESMERNAPSVHVQTLPAHA